MRYHFQCETCGHGTEVVRSIVDGPPESVPCAGCGGEQTRVWTSPEVHTPNQFIDFTHPGQNIAQAAGRTPQQQERLYGKIIDSYKKVRAAKRRSLSRQPEGKIDVTDIPREMYQARMNQFGKNYWKEEGAKALKRDGLI